MALEYSAFPSFKQFSFNSKVLEIGDYSSLEMSWSRINALLQAAFITYHDIATVSAAWQKYGFSTEFIGDEDTLQCFIASDENATVIAFRGSDGFWDWVTNFEILTIDRPYGKVHSGMFTAYLGARKKIEQQVARSIESGKPVWFTGHSLGGALAHISVQENLYQQERSNAMVGLCTFGEPRCLQLDDESHDASLGLPLGYYRVVNRNDVVAQIPPTLSHYGQLVELRDRSLFDQNSDENQCLHDPLCGSTENEKKDEPILEPISELFSDTWAKIAELGGDLSKVENKPTAVESNDYRHYFELLEEKGEQIYRQAKKDFSIAKKLFEKTLENIIDDANSKTELHYKRWRNADIDERINLTLSSLLDHFPDEYQREVEHYEQEHAKKSTIMTTYTNKLHPGDTFPIVTATTLGGDTVELGKPRAGKVNSDFAAWQMVVLYRGQHCPMCTEYLEQLRDMVEDLAAIGIDLLAVSADSAEQLKAHLERTDKHHFANPNFPFAHGLKQQDLETLGAFISVPRSEKETDHNFAEPALFIVNEEGKLHVVEYTNNPFVRADLATLLRGLKWIRNPENNYPIRGTAK